MISLFERENRTKVLCLRHDRYEFVALLAPDLPPLLALFVHYILLERLPGTCAPHFEEEGSFAQVYFQPKFFASLAVLCVSRRQAP